MTDNTHSAATNSSVDERPLKRPRISNQDSRATEVVQNVQSLIEDQQLELQEAKEEIKKLKSKVAKQNRDSDKREKKIRDTFSQLEAQRREHRENLQKFEEDWEHESRALRQHYRGEMEKFERLVATAKALVGSNLKESGEKVGQLEEALKELE